jgi:large exoprotein involved in heme utilization and adhesion
MSLGDDVANFLLSNDTSITYALGKLEFSLDSFRVDYEGYREIGHQIRSGGVTVAEGSRSEGSTTAAVYTPRRDLISVPANLDLSGRTGGSISQQAMIVHECTHALMDYHRYQTTGTIQETAAYIAGALYAAAKMIRLSGGSNQQTNAILNAAFAIVRGRSMVSTPGQRLAAADRDVAALMSAINAHSDYRTAHRPDVADGISGGLINPWYLPRH